MVWSPLAGGLLSGKYDRDSKGPQGSRRVSFDFPPVDRERAFACVDAMRAVAKQHNVSVARIALAWLLHRPFVMSVIVRATSIEQLEDNIAATEVSLSAEELAPTRSRECVATGISGLDDRASGCRARRHGAGRETINPASRGHFF